LRYVSRTAALAVASLLLAIACTPADPPAGAGDPTPKPTVQRARAPTPTPQPIRTAEPRQNNLPTPVAQTPTDIRVTQVVDGLQLPAALAFAPDGRLFFNEIQKGMVRILDASGVLQAEPFETLKISRRKEHGVLGLALDPDFATNHYVYVFYSQAANNGVDPDDNRIVRFTERDGLAHNRTIIRENLPIGICCHNGGRLAFGPDGKLYVTVGDQNQAERAQLPNRLNGKILRLNPDGTLPSDNPLPNSPVFALGFRNPYGLDFHPLTGVPYVTENGEEGHDEVNRVVAGGNYGSPEMDGIVNDPRFVDPVWESGLGRLAPTGAAFYTGQAMPEYTYDLFFCAFVTGDLTRIRLGGPSLDQVAEQGVVAKDCYLDVVNSPDGSLYFTSITAIHRFGR